jgi:hypothetical protein
MTSSALHVTAWGAANRSTVSVGAMLWEPSVPASAGRAIKTRAGTAAIVHN